jgi:hypothetical protein
VPGPPAQPHLHNRCARPKYRRVGHHQLSRLLGILRDWAYHRPLADFSRMQPAQPNPWMIVNMCFVKMVGTAGAKEAKLQGSSSVVRGNAATEAAQGETLMTKLACSILCSRRGGASFLVILPYEGKNKNTYLGLNWFKQHSSDLAHG